MKLEPWVIRRASAPESVLDRQKTWAFSVGTLFFAVISYAFVFLSVPDVYQNSEPRILLRSILSADAAWFVLLAWVLTSSCYFGLSKWRGMWKSAMQTSFASRILAWRRFRCSFSVTVSLALVWLLMARMLGFVDIHFVGVDVRFLLSEFYLITDPLASFILLFLVLDIIRTDLFATSFRFRGAFMVSFLVSISIESWVWSMHFSEEGLSAEWYIPLILAVLWGALNTYESFLKRQRGSFWSRLGAGLGLVVVLSVATSLMNSGFASSWSFFDAEVLDSTKLLFWSVSSLACVNIAVLHRISRPLTRAD